MDEFHNTLAVPVSMKGLNASLYTCMDTGFTLEPIIELQNCLGHVIHVRSRALGNSYRNQRPIYSLTTISIAAVPAVTKPSTLFARWVGTLEVQSGNIDARSRWWTPVPSWTSWHQSNNSLNWPTVGCVTSWISARPAGRMKECRCQEILLR